MCGLMLLAKVSTPGGVRNHRSTYTEGFICFLGVCSCFLWFFSDSYKIFVGINTSVSLESNGFNPTEAN